MKNKLGVLLGVPVLGLIIVNGCTDEKGVGPTPSETLALSRSVATVEADGITSTGGRAEGTVSPIFVSMNRRLAAMGLNVRVGMAEWVTAAHTNQVGQTIFVNDRVKQLDHHWVPGDPRRGGRTNITYLVDQSDGAATGGLSNAQTEAAIDRAMATWQAVECSTIPIVKVEDSGADPDIVDAFIPKFRRKNLGTTLADITHAGWLPRDFFDALAPGGGDFILGVTATAFFVDENDNFTDINGDGKFDVAFREIYYNNNFTWGIDAGAFPVFDVETVALHEAGHGFSQDHFGMIFRTDANGELHFAPFAVMNAAISRQAQSFEGTDIGGHCSIWTSWPIK